MSSVKLNGNLYREKGGNGKGNVSQTTDKRLAAPSELSRLGFILSPDGRNW
jgi:hypothetical protein